MFPCRMQVRLTQLSEDSVRTQHNAVHGRGPVYTRVSLERTHKSRLPPYRKVAEQKKQTYTMWPSLRSITFVSVLLWVYRAQTWLVVTVRVRSPRTDAFERSNRRDQCVLAGG